MNQNTESARQAFKEKVLDMCLRGKPSVEVFSFLLDSFIDFTSSEFGFIGDVLEDTDGAPFLRTRAISNIAWDQTSRELYQPERMEFRNLETLFGFTLRTGLPMISNSPSSSPQAGGLPTGHPPLTSYLGVPIFKHDKMVGMMGVANCQSGYSNDSLEELRPELELSAFVISHYQLSKQLNDVTQHYDELVRTIDDGIITISESGQILTSNPAIREILGYTPAELQGRPITTIMPDRLKPLHEQSLARYLTTGEATILGKQVQVAARHKNGAELPVDLIVHELSVSGQRHFSGFIRNTEKTSKERENQNTALELNQLIDSANTPIFGIDNDQRIVMWNKHCEALLNLSADAAVGQKITEVWPNDVHVMKAVVEDALKGIETESCPISLSGKAHKDMSLLINFSTRRDLDGRVAGVICVAQDVSRIRLEEEALRVTSQNEAVGHLTGGIAHSFNNLFTVLSGNTRLLNSYILQDDKDAALIIDDAKSAIDEGILLTKHLLAFSRQTRLQPENVDLMEHLKEERPSIEATLGRPITLILREEIRFTDVRVDKALLSSCLIALLTNAAESSAREKDIKLQLLNAPGRDISSSEPLAEELYIGVEISDSGTGMTEDIQRQAFTPFFTTKDNGIGLGLSMAYGSVKQMRGDISLTSSPASGTRVTIWLPVLNSVVADNVRV